MTNTRLRIILLSVFTLPINLNTHEGGKGMACFRNGAIAIFLFASFLTAQGFRATVVGRVTDDTGAVLPGAMITITNIGTNESRSVIVNDSGEYSIPQLAPGQYRSEEHTSELQSH